MVSSPICIRLALSQSRKPSDLAKTQAIAADALKIERYINSCMEKEFIRTFDFAMLAVELSMDQGRVLELLSTMACNDDAIAICNLQKRPRTPAAGAASSRRSNQSNAVAPAWIGTPSVAAEAHK